MSTIQPKPNRKARQIAVSDSVALVLCEDGTLWAYDLLVKVAEWERLPDIPAARVRSVEVPAMDPETGEDLGQATVSAKSPAKSAKSAKRLKPHPNATDAETT